MTETNPHIKVGSKWQSKDSYKRKDFGEAIVVAIGLENLIYKRDVEYTGSIESFLLVYEPIPVKLYLYMNTHSGLLFMHPDAPIGGMLAGGSPVQKYVGEVIDFQSK